MARSRSTAARFDFRGGVNTTFSEDVLDTTELRKVKNGRVLQADVEKRNGTQRIHDAAIGAAAAVMGLYQWDAPAGKQVVAIAGTEFYHKLAAGTDFTEVLSALSTTKKARFKTFRSGAVIKLVIANGELRTWDGAALSAAIAGAPAAVDFALYKNRGFAIEGTKTLHFSRINDPTLWGVANLGGSADVETYDSEPLVGIIVVGSSLLLCKEDSIARFTGVDTDDIQIDTETEGVSAEVGLMAPHTLIRVDEIAFGLSDRGPYIISEAGVQAKGLKVQKEFDFANKEKWADAVAVHNRGRRTVELSIPAGAETTNLTTWEWNYRTDSWSGPFIRTGSGLCTAARFERADGTESAIYGGYDGFVRELDAPAALGAKDDVLRDGTGGTNVELDVELPVILGDDPRVVKSLRAKQHVQADLKTNGSLTAYWSSEMGNGSVAIPSRGAGVKNYVYKLGGNAKGTRIVAGFRDSTSEIVRLVGVLSSIAAGRKGR
jgi:hypothetical protein